MAAIAGALAFWGTQARHQEVPTHLRMETAGAEGAATARPSTLVRLISCEKLPNVPGKAITTAIVDFPPNAFSPRHRHPGSVTAFVLEGALRSQLAGGPAVVYTKEQTWFEPVAEIDGRVVGYSSIERIKRIWSERNTPEIGPMAADRADRR